MAYRLGVDVGGTFTDFLLLDEESRPDTSPPRCPLHPEDSSIGVLNGVATLLRRYRASSPVAHQTRDARHHRRHQRRAHRHVARSVGLVTTAGFEDTLQVARSLLPRRAGRLGHLCQEAAYLRTA